MNDSSYSRRRSAAAAAQRKEGRDVALRRRLRPLIAVASVPAGLYANPPAPLLFTVILRSHLVATKDLASACAFTCSSMSIRHSSTRLPAAAVLGVGASLPCLARRGGPACRRQSRPEVRLMSLRIQIRNGTHQNYSSYSHCRSAAIAAQEKRTRDVFLPACLVS